MKWFMAPLGTPEPRCFVRDGRFIDDWPPGWVPMTQGVESVVMLYRNGTLILRSLPDLLPGECVMVGVESDDQMTRKIFDHVVGNWGGAGFVLKGWTVHQAGMVACTSSRSDLPVKEYFSLASGVAM